MNKERLYIALIESLNLMSRKSRSHPDFKVILDSASALLTETYMGIPAKEKVRTGMLPSKKVVRYPQVPPSDIQKQVKKKFVCSEIERQLAAELDPLAKWDIPNTEFPQVMTEAEFMSMLATKCATNPSPFWRADIEVMDWLYSKGITVIPNNL